MINETARSDNRLLAALPEAEYQRLLPKLEPKFHSPMFLPETQSSCPML